MREVPFYRRAASELVILVIAVLLAARIDWLCCGSGVNTKIEKCGDAVETNAHVIQCTELKYCHT